MTPFIEDSYTPAADASRVTIRSAGETEPYFRAVVFRERSARKGNRAPSPFTPSSPVTAASGRGSRA